MPPSGGYLSGHCGGARNPESHGHCVGSWPRGSSAEATDEVKCVCECHDPDTGEAFLLRLLDEVSWTVRETDGTETKFRTEEEARAFAALCEDAKLPRCGSIQPGTSVACGLSISPHELHEAGAVTWQNLEYVIEPAGAAPTLVEEGAA